MDFPACGFSCNRRKWTKTELKGASAVSQQTASQRPGYAHWSRDLDGIIMARPLGRVWNTGAKLTPVELDLVG